MNDSGKENLNDKTRLKAALDEIVRQVPVIDVHTHLFAPQFGVMNLSGIDELLTYHYLVAELFRSSPVRPDRFWRLSTSDQADLVWDALFVRNTPLSEATRGVVTVLSAFGIDPDGASLDEIRSFFREQDIDDHIDRVFDLARVRAVVMTNDPFDADEMKVWERKEPIDRRFYPSLRMDRLLNNWPHTCGYLASIGHSVDVHMSGDTIPSIRNYLDECITLMAPLYMAVSLPDSFQYPAGDVRNRLINEVVLPAAREHSLPVTLMVGVRRGVNTSLGPAGDGVGRADVSAVERLCVENPDVRFLATFLSRENQHELCVAARKFSNLMPFGCWWFLNNPSIIAEITNERLELLGTSFIPQHSDARVLEQLIYKWQHSRGVIAECLADSYGRLVAVGGKVSRKQIERDVKKLFEGNFREWVGPTENMVAELGGFENGEDVPSFPLVDSVANPD